MSEPVTIKPAKLFRTAAADAPSFRQHLTPGEANLDFLSCGQYDLPAGTRMQSLALPGQEALLFQWDGQSCVRIDGTAHELAPEAGAERIWKHWHELGIPHDQVVSELLVLSELWGERPFERSAIEASILEVVAALQVRYPKPSGLTIAEADKAPLL